MRRVATAVTGAALLLIAATATGAAGSPEPEGQPRTTAAGAAGFEATQVDDASGVGSVQEVGIRDVNGDRLGTVLLRQKDGYVKVRATLHSVPEGFHGFHVHDVGICDPNAEGGPFLSAGGHYVGDGTTHGDHAGDMPSLLFRSGGNARLAFRTDGFMLAELRAGDGAAVMIHAGLDNFANIPERYTVDGVPGPDATTLATGDAGARMACGVV